MSIYLISAERNNQSGMWSSAESWQRVSTTHRLRINECVPLSLHLPLFLCRCYNKTNGTFSSGTLPLMHRVAPCQQDGLEMVPLGQVSSQCHGSGSQRHSGDQQADVGYRPDEHKESSPSQHSCCLVGNNENCPADNTGESFVFFFLFQFFSLSSSLCLVFSLSLRDDLSIKI